MEDLIQLEKILAREKAAISICSELNNIIDLKTTLVSVIDKIKTITGCEAVSIRLYDDGDYPYYVYDGFSKSFIKKENNLCSKDKNGKRIPDPDGKGYLLDCMCGKVIRGQYDPSQKFFTDKGSFWSNNTTKLLATASEEDCQGYTSNYCISCKYESVALVPIKKRDEILGLIQLNDMRIGMFYNGLIEFLEMIGEQIGLAVQSSMIQNQLKESLYRLKETRSQQRALLNSIPDIAWLKDKESKYIAVNQAFAESCGFNQEDAAGKTDLEIYPRELAEFYRNADIEVVETGYRVRVTEPYSDHHGNITWIDTIKVPFLDESGEVIGTVGIARDITERKLLEDRLRESEQRLADIISFLPDATFVINGEGKVIAWNRATEEMTGIKAEDMLGKGNYEHSIPFYSIRQPILIDLVLNPDTEIEKNYFFIKKEKDFLIAETDVPSVKGESRFLWGKATPLYDSQGKVVGAIQSIRDITEKKQAEEALKKSENFYRTIFETTGTSTIFIEDDFTISLVNKEFKKLSGYSKEEIEGKKKIVEFITAKEMERLETYHRTRRINPDQAPRNYETQLMDKQGKFRDLYVTVDLIPGTKTSLVSLLDITEIKQVQEKIRLADEVFENSAMGIMVTTPEGIIQRVNPAFSYITNYSEEEVLGKDSRFIMPEYALDQVDNDIQKPLNDESQIRTESWRKRKNGESYFEGSTISVIRDATGKIVQVVKTFRDITEEVKLREEKRRIKEQTEKILKIASMSAISACIVHEITQPLNAIKVTTDGFAFWHERGRILEMESILTKFKTISEQVNRINEIIRNMRSFASLGKTEELMPCDLNIAVKRVLDILDHQLAAHDITVKRDIADNQKNVLATNTGLEEIVINIVANAIQASNTANRIDKEIAFTTWEEDNAVLLVISDNAGGINEGELDSIFEPYFSTKNPGEGMGLGLMIVKSLVEKYNGKIKVKNNEKGGATFRLEFPAVEI